MSNTIGPRLVVAVVDEQLSCIQPAGGRLYVRHRSPTMKLRPRSISAMVVEHDFHRCACLGHEPEPGRSVG